MREVTDQDYERVTLPEQTDNEYLERYWRFEYDISKSPAVNLYRFNDILGFYRDECRAWELHNNGWSGLNRRIRDKYLMPKIEKFFEDVKEFGGVGIMPIKNYDFDLDRKEGKKETDNKLNWSLLPMTSLEGVVRVFEKGAIKYSGKHTWLPGISFSKLHSAILRHLYAWFWIGEDIDEESGESHLSHIVANCLMLISYSENKDFDDRKGT